MEAENQRQTQAPAAAEPAHAQVVEEQPVSQLFVLTHRP